MIRLVALAWVLCLPALGLAAGTDYEARVQRILKQTPLIDGHNDLPWEIRERFQSQLTKVDLKSDTSKLTPPPVWIMSAWDLTLTAFPVVRVASRPSIAIRRC